MQKLQKYQSIQYLRAFAALIVVLHHARNPQPWLFNPFVGYGVGQSGVDIFFVISGFIMYSAARHEEILTFAHRRLVRIAPLYWLATLLSFVAIEKGAVLHPGGANLAFLLKSMLFVPQYNLAHPGEIWPCLIAGWTLDYEMFFYLIFALGLISRRLIVTAFGLLGALLGAGLIIKSENPVWTTYTDPLLAEFAGGLLLGRFQAQICKPAAILLLPVGLITLAFSPLLSAPRILVWGAPALAVLIGALSLERVGRLPRVRLPALLGDASYSIYLFQSFAILLTSKIIERLPVFGPAQLASLIVLGALVAVVLGLVVHLSIERPLILRLTRRTQIPPRAALAASH